MKNRQQQQQQQRTLAVKGNSAAQSSATTLAMAAATAHNESGADAASGGMQIDGFAQVLEMLKIADRDFRESLLRRIAVRDRQLAINLIRELGL